MTLEELAGHWRAEAGRLHSWGQDSAARVLERCLEDLEAVDRTDARLVGYAEAAQLSGYSVAHLRRLVRAGRLRDHADAGPVQLAVAELPRKPAKPALPTLVGGS